MHGFFPLLSFLAFIMMWVLVSGHRSVSLMPLGCWAGKDEQAEGVGEGCSTGSNHHVPASLSACAFLQLQRCPAAFLGASSEFSLFLGLWSPFIYFLKNCLGHSTSPFSAKINASSLPIINEVIFLLFWEVKCCYNHMPLICNTLSVSAYSVLSLLIASPMDCSAPGCPRPPDPGTGSSRGMLSWARHLLAFGLHRAAHWLLSPALWIPSSATGFGLSSEHFQKAGFTNGPWVPSWSPFCHQWLHCVILHLLTVTPGCPTEGFLKLLASFDSLHLPLLGLCTHPHSMPALELSMQELLVG